MFVCHKNGKSAILCHQSDTQRSQKPCSCQRRCLPPLYVIREGEGKTTHTKSGKKRRVATNRAKRGHGRYVIQQAGLLKKSIRRQRLTKNSRNRHRAAVGIGVHLKGKTGETAFYWHMVERGTKNMPAVPFLRPAFDHHKDEAVQRFKKKLGERIDKLK